MLKTTERLNLITRLDGHGLSLSLIEKHATEDLWRLCSDLETRQIPQAWYAGHAEIQKEMVDSEGFYGYMDSFASGGVDPSKANEAIGELHLHGESALDYLANCLTSSIKTTEYYKKHVFYGYLRNFGGMDVDKGQAETIAENLYLYGERFERPISEMPDAERILFLEPCLNNDNLVPDPNMVFPMLAAQPELLGLIRFMGDRRLVEDRGVVRMNLSCEHYENLSAAPSDIQRKLKSLLGMLNEKDASMLILNWVGNGCRRHDLSVLDTKLHGEGRGDVVVDALYSRSGYINLIYGERIKGVSLAGLGSKKEDILIYAITNKKNGFIRLVSENFETFEGMSSHSVLFDGKFYATHVNINTLSAKNLADCEQVLAHGVRFDELEHDRQYTFEEIRVLYQQPAQLYRLYAGLKQERVDERLIAFRQMTKHDLPHYLSCIRKDDEAWIGELASMLSEKPLSVWMERDFAHIEGLTHKDAVGLLIHHSGLAGLVPQMKTRADAAITLRSRDGAQGCTTIEEIKAGVLENDPEWGRLAQSMGLESRFIEKNRERIMEFLCRDGAEIANTYYGSLDTESQCESFRRVVKSVLMGKFDALKYYADDLSRELDIRISESQKSLWAENTAQSEGRITVREHDDFYSTMAVGVTPCETCLSYKSGIYRDCLLSAFDSNKKILYAEMDGKIVARAFIRLTKGAHEEPGTKKENTSLSFADMELEEDRAEGSKGSQEGLIVFLETSYSAGIADEAYERVRALFAGLVEKKAERLGAMPVMSEYYGTVLPEEYSRTRFYVYISKSKAGMQYLDSLDGSVSVSDEGGYRVNSFYVRNEDMI